MTVSNVNLELDHITPAIIRAYVSYTVSFTPLERHLAALGMRFREEIAIIENDILETLLPPGGEAPVPDVLANYPNRLLTVSDGDTDLILHINNRRLNIPHNILHNEDPASMNPDEVNARVTVRPIGFFLASGSISVSSMEIVPTL